MQALIGLKKHISIMHSLYTNDVSDCLKPAGISLTFIHRHAKNNANPCICSIALVSRRLSMIFVELSGHELCTEWRRPKLKNKILHCGQYRHIALLKRTHKQVKCVTVLFTKQHAYTLKEFLQFPSRFSTQNAIIALTLFSANLFPSLSAFKCYL